MATPTNPPPQLPIDSIVGDASLTNQQPQHQHQLLQAQPQHPKEVNVAVFCRVGQETVQEIVAKTAELFNNLKTMSPPNGTAQSMNERENLKFKARENLKHIDVHFTRLRKIYEKCNESIGLEFIQNVENLIPMKDDDVMKIDDKTTTVKSNQEKEHQELTELLQLKNRQIKEVIDNLRSIIWEINTMLAMSKP